MNPYEVLGVDKDATPDEIKKAYRSKAKTSHPDTNNGQNGAEFLDLQKAYLVLSDPENKAKFDQEGTFNDPFRNTQHNSLETAAKEIIMGILNAILGSKEVELSLFELKRLVGSAHYMANTDFRKLVSVKKSVMSMKKKMKLKKGADDIILTSILEEKINTLNKEIELAKWKRKACSLANSIVNSWEYDKVETLKDLFKWQNPADLIGADISKLWSKEW